MNSQAAAIYKAHQIETMCTALTALQRVKSFDYPAASYAVFGGTYDGIMDSEAGLAGMRGKVAAWSMWTGQMTDAIMARS